MSSTLDDNNASVAHVARPAVSEQGARGGGDNGGDDGGATVV
jgi:hypothetical protein